MKKLITIAVLLYAGWFGYSQFQKASAGNEGSTKAAISSQSVVRQMKSSFQCDGRTHCSQMTSCEEAIYYVRNCPNTKMDGDRDGVPCERQWCSR